MHSNRLARDEQGEPDHAEHARENIAQPALAGSIGDIADTDGHDGGSRVGRYGEQLRVGGFVAKPTDDRRQEERKGIQRHIGAHIDEGVQPSLPVCDTSPEVPHLKGFMLGAGLLVELQAADDALAVGRGEEGGVVGEVVDHPDGDDADEYGRDAFEDEDPGPAGLVADAVHLADGCCEEAAEGAGERGGGEKDGGSDTEFVAFVPAGEVVVDAGEKACGKLR